MNVNTKIISLNWIGTNSLIEWTKLHFYYIPESLEKAQAWINLMQELIVELNDREHWVELKITPNEKNGQYTHAELLDFIQQLNTPTKVKGVWYIKNEYKNLFFLIPSSPGSIPTWKLLTANQE